MTRPRHESPGALLDLLSAVDVQSNVAVYVQVENHIQFAISSGGLKSGDQLPAVRELAERLKVNVNTVSKAYRDLIVMGLLYARRGLGVFVSKDIGEKCGENCRRRVLARLSEVVCESRAAGFDDKEIVEIVGKMLKLKANPGSGLAPALQTYLRRRK